GVLAPGPADVASRCGDRDDLRRPQRVEQLHLPARADTERGHTRPAVGAVGVPDPVRDRRTRVDGGCGALHPADLRPLLVRSPTTLEWSGRRSGQVAFTTPEQKRATAAHPSPGATPRCCGPFQFPNTYPSVETHPPERLATPMPPTPPTPASHDPPPPPPPRTASTQRFPTPPACGTTGWEEKTIIRSTVRWANRSGPSTPGSPPMPAAAAPSSCVPSPIWPVTKVCTSSWTSEPDCPHNR